MPEAGTYRIEAGGETTRSTSPATASIQVVASDPPEPVAARGAAFRTLTAGRG